MRKSKKIRVISNIKDKKYSENKKKPEFLNRMFIKLMKLNVFKCDI